MLASNDHNNGFHGNDFYNTFCLKKMTLLPPLPNGKLTNVYPYLQKPVNSIRHYVIMQFQKVAFDI